MTILLDKYKSLSSVHRKRIINNIDYDTAIRLSRNEKVDCWDPQIINQIFKNIPGYLLSCYPEEIIDRFYSKLAKHNGLNTNQLLFMISKLKTEEIIFNL